MNSALSRRLAFAGLFIAVTVAMLIPSEGDVRVAPETRQLYEWIDSIPPGSQVIVSFDHEASALPEIRPLALALLRHCFERDLVPIGVSLLAEGTGIGFALMDQTADEYDKTYGEDYAFLGFKPQFIAAILSMGESIPATYPEDYLGTPIDSLPAMVGVTTYDDVVGVLSIADGSMTTHWVEYGEARFGVPIAGAVTAAMITSYDPYLASGQMVALMGGLRGAAEYEQLIGIGGGGSRGLLAQSVSHLYVLAMIIIGNLLWWRARRRKGKESV